MNQLNNEKDRLEKEIEDELQQIERLQEELKERKERVEELQEELRETNEQIREVKGKRKEVPKNNKRKNNEELDDKKKKRTKKFQEELSNEISEEEEIDEEIIQQEELVSLFKRAYKYEMKKNGKMIEYWCEYAERFEERIKGIMMDDSMISRKVATSIVYREIDKQIPDLSAESLWKKTEGARKANFIFATLGKGEIKKMKETNISWITKMRWHDIKEFVVNEMAKRSAGKIQILEETNEERMIENQKLLAKGENFRMKKDYLYSF